MLANNIPASVFLVKYDEARTKVYLNDEIEQLTGYHRDDFMSNKLSLLDLYHPDEKEKLRFIIDEALHNRKPYKVTCRIRRKDGNYVWIEEYGEGIIINNEVAYTPFEKAIKHHDHLNEDLLDLVKILSL